MNATNRPSGLIAGWNESPFASAPPLLTLTRSVTPATRSRTKTSIPSFSSPDTKSGASDSNATQRPSALIDGHQE